MAKDKVLYIGLFLSDAVRTELLHRVKPTHPQVHATHLTLAFRPSDEIIEKAKEFLGKRFLIDVVGYARDEKGEAVMVRKDTLPFPCQNEFPHITIGCAQNVSPVYSNDLLKELGKEGWFIAHFPETSSSATFKRFTLEVTFDTYPRSNQG